MSRPRPDAPTASPPESFRGVNNRLAADQLPPGFVAAAQNYRMREGNCAPRRGVIKPGWLNLTQAGAGSKAIRSPGLAYGVAVFKDPNGTEWVIQCSAGDVFRCRQHNERFALPIPEGVRVLGPCVPVQAFNKVFLFRGRWLAPLVINDLDTGVEDLIPRWTVASVPTAPTGADPIDFDEYAYGPWQTVTSVVSVGTLATVITPTEHGYVTGADITIRDATQTEYNGRYNIVVLDAFTFTYQFAGSATTPATGTIVVSNQSYYWKALLGAQAITSITRVGTTATATTTAAHGYTTGDQINVTGADQSQYNGTFAITVTGGSTFTYTMTADPGASATGTLKCCRRPDAASVDWARSYAILPNADDALFINNRLLVPTAYTPGVDGYDASSAWTKKDFIVATDVLDELHFDFENEFRINQGSADEIVALVKYNQDTVIVLKDSSWGILSNIRIDLSNLTLDMRNDGYGACARAGLVVGKDVIFPASRRGLVSLKQNEQGKINGTDIPFSDDIQGYVNRINWTLASQQRIAVWDDKIYWAVALDAGEIRTPKGALSAPFPGTLTYACSPGEMYYWNGVGAAVLGYNGGFQLTSAGYFTATNYGFGFTGVSGGGLGVWRVVLATNNAMLVYDYRTAAWCGMDTGEPFCVQEFVLLHYNGQQRLAFVGKDGWTNLVEEAVSGDQISDGVYTSATDSGLTWAEITTDLTSRGLSYESDRPKRFHRLNVVLGVWNARFTLTANTGAAHQTQALRSAVEFSRTRYLKPFDKPPYVSGNTNDDHATRGRGNYSVPLDEAGVSLGAAGLLVSQTQEITVGASVRTLAHRYIQFRVQNDQGRCAVEAIGTEASAGQNRDNVII